MTAQKAGPRVVISKDGPYLVAGAIPLATQTIVADAEGGSEAWSEGPAIKTQANYALCRCGHSKTKPLCDGTHARVGFDGTETASRSTYLQQAEVLAGPTMQLTDAQQLCAFGRFCDPNGQVWSQVAHTDDPDVREIFCAEVTDHSEAMGLT